MRRSLAMCVLMMIPLLTACGGGAGSGSEELALTIRGEYLSAGGCTAQAEITADYGQRVYTYTVQLDVEGEETALTVTAPEMVAGVRARCAGGESWLEYDGAVLETGPLTPDGLSPLGGAAALWEAARSGFMDSCTMERLDQTETLRVLCRSPELEAGEGLETTLWFDADSHALLRGELAWEGRTVIPCILSGFARR